MSIPSTPASTNGSASCDVLFDRSPILPLRCGEDSEEQSRDELFRGIFSHGEISLVRLRVGKEVVCSANWTYAWIGFVRDHMTLGRMDPHISGG